MDRYLVVMLGGAAGSLARYAAGTAIMRRFGGRFPLGTLVINITRSFLIGLLMTLLTERLKPHTNWRLLLVVGFLGGYTTFSSMKRTRPFETAVHGWGCSTSLAVWASGTSQFGLEQCSQAVVRREIVASPQGLGRENG